MSDSYKSFRSIKNGFDSVRLFQILQHVLVGVVDEGVGDEAVAVLGEGVVSPDVFAEVLKMNKMLD